MSRPPIDAPPFVKAIETRETPLQGPVGPNVFAFGEDRPMGRIRAYTTAGLTPFAGRGSPREFHLLGHVHVDGDKVVRVEGFNGIEGEKWAKLAAEALTKNGHLAEQADVILSTPLRGCPYTGIR